MIKYLEYALNIHNPKIVFIASISALSSLTKLLVACMSSRSSRNAGISTESTASPTAKVTTKSKVLCCSLNASLIPLAIASSRSSLEMVESLIYFFFGDCSISPFRSPPDCWNTHDGSNAEWFEIYWQDNIILTKWAERKTMRASLSKGHVASVIFNKNVKFGPVWP